MGVIPESRQKMQEAKVGKLPILNSENELLFLICRGDLKRERLNPNASLDQSKQLQCGAVILASEVRSLIGINRAKAIFDAGADIFSLDLDDGAGGMPVDFIRFLKQQYPDVDVQVGPVASTHQIKEVCEAGADGLWVSGAGPGSANRLYELVKNARQNYSSPVMVDGGIRDSSCALKGLCLGACAVSFDAALLAGTEEASGDHVFAEGAIRMKLQQIRSDDALTTKLGTRSIVVDKGSIRDYIPHLMQPVMVGMQELGLKNLTDVVTGLRTGTLRLERRMKGRLAPDPALKLQRVAVSGLHTQW